MMASNNHFLRITCYKIVFKSCSSFTLDKLQLSPKQCKLCGAQLLLPTPVGGVLEQVLHGQLSRLSLPAQQESGWTRLSTIYGSSNVTGESTFKRMLVILRQVRCSSVQPRNQPRSSTPVRIVPFRSLPLLLCSGKDRDVFTCTTCPSAFSCSICSLAVLDSGN